MRFPRESACIFRQGKLRVINALICRGRVLIVTYQLHFSLGLKDGGEKMEERKSCWHWLIAGLVALGILGWLMSYVGDSSAKKLTEGTRTLAQEGLESAGYMFARAEADGSILRVVGTAPDKAAAEAACKAAKDKVAGRIGIPGIFSAVECVMTYPGSDATVETASTGAEVKSEAPATIPAAAKAEATNCQVRLTEAGKSGTVSFARSKGQILTGQDVLDRVAAVAKECKQFAIEIGGHTDTGGAAEMNQRLSDLRSNAVRTYLINKGVAATQLTAKGYGESKPLVNDFPEGNADVPGQPDSPLRAKNRRTEFTVTALQ
jgi:outer membrane protein OmpA-like peptidoglycan-associated protein